AACLTAPQARTCPTVAPRRRQDSVARTVPTFSLRLGRDRVIARSVLQRIGASAPRTDDVAVGATPIAPAQPAGGFIYTLSALQGCDDLQGVEARIRALLSDSVPGSPVTLRRLV